MKLRMFKDRVPIGNLIKRTVSKECYRPGIKPFYCKLNGNGKK